LAHGCRNIWGDAADRLQSALEEDTLLPTGAAPTLASEAAYRALCAARADLSHALGLMCPPPPPWRGSGAEPDDLREAALALCGGLAADRADPSGQHDPTGSAWLATGLGDPDAVATARRLLMSVEVAFTLP